jgi:hypothetical protein
MWDDAGRAQAPPDRASVDTVMMFLKSNPLRAARAASMID